MKFPSYFDTQMLPLPDIIICHRVLFVAVSYDDILRYTQKCTFYEKPQGAVKKHVFITDFYELAKIHVQYNNNAAWT